MKRLGLGQSLADRRLGLGGETTPTWRGYGPVDKATQRAAWTFGPHGKVVFQTALAVLTEPYGPVSVHYDHGQTRQWVLARYGGEPADDDPADSQ